MMKLRLRLLHQYRTTQPISITSLTCAIVSIVYDMVSPLKDSLEINTEETPDDWIAHALLGTTSLFSNNVDKSLDELNSAMLLVPDNDAGDLFRAILKLSTISPPIQNSTPRRGC